MASAGPDWRTDAATQIRWGLEYIKDTYGSPCAAWSHEEATGWYRGVLGVRAQVCGSNVSAASSKYGRMWLHVSAGAVM
jgi:hypothetical protein